MFYVKSFSFLFSLFLLTNALIVKLIVRQRYFLGAKHSEEGAPRKFVVVFSGHIILLKIATKISFFFFKQEFNKEKRHYLPFSRTHTQWKDFQ